VLWAKSVKPSRRTSGKRKNGRLDIGLLHRHRQALSRVWKAASIIPWGGMFLFQPLKGVLAIRSHRVVATNYPHCSSYVAVLQLGTHGVSQSKSRLLGTAGVRSQREWIKVVERGNPLFDYS
jgi:hypothetical protein